MSGGSKFFERGRKQRVLAMSQRIIPVLIAGGAGTRLWPASREGGPKPFQSLGRARTLLQDTALRFRGPLFDDPIVVCADRHVALARAQLAEAGVEPLAVIAEPDGRNTGPAAVAAAAAGLKHWPGAPLLLVHADNLVSDLEALHAEIAAGLPDARLGHIVLFGAPPTGPSTDYGYIEAGEVDPETGACRVARFLEKPDAAAAVVLAADPRCSWNAGMFLIDPKSFLAEAARLAPDMTSPARAAADEAILADGVLLLSSRFLEAPSIAVDPAVLERTDAARVRTGRFGWSDAGSWRAVWDYGDRDGDGNVLVGDVVVAAPSRGVLVQADGATVVLVGVEDLVVVVQNGVVMVAARGLADQAYKMMDFVERPDLR